jgi:hypothetical protein
LVVAVAVFYAFNVPANLFAQVSGSISGTVLDSSGAAVPGAKVVLTDQASQVTRETVTNNSGYFTFAAIIPGTYTVSVEMKNFKIWKQDGVVIHTGDVRTLADINLQLGGAAETVEVNASAVTLVPVDSGAREDVLTTRDIEDLPLESRNISELVKVLPGVTNVQQGISGGAKYLNFLNAGVGGSDVGVGLSVGGAAYRGGTAYLNDGANIIDPGCNCWGLATIEPRMTQEVQIEMSNFGADVQKGPTVINTIGKSGTKEYHGSLWFDVRNDVLNANDWQDNASKTPRGHAHYYYPGGDFGGPIPFTRKKLFFWFGYDHFLQNTGNAYPLESYIPTGPNGVGASGLVNGIFNSTDPTTAALCPNLDQNGNSTTPVTGTACASINGMVLPDGTVVTNGVIPAKYLDPGAMALEKVWPKPNVTNTAAFGGNNYFQSIPGIHNGYIYRMRFDYDLNDSNKFFVSYQYGDDSQLASGTGAHVWYNPGNIIPFPGGGIQTITESRTGTAHFVHIFGPTATNEFVAAWGWQNGPNSANINAVWKSTLGYPSNYASIFGNPNVHMIPSYNGQGLSFPDFSEPDLFEGGAWASKKQTPAFADNFTKVWQTHTIKIGGYWETVGNLQGPYAYQNGVFSFGGQNPDLFPVNNYTGAIGSSVNPLADFITGIVSGYQEANYEPYQNMVYHTLSGYIDDSWHASRKLTLRGGLRFDHIGRWYDRSSTDGMAAFFPDLVASDVAAGTALAGVRWHGVDPGVPLGGSPVRKVFTSPRIGFAYDVFGTGKTVVRGGWGRYRWNDQVNDYLGTLTVSQNQITYGLPGGKNVLMSQLGNITPPTTGVINYAGGVTNGQIYATDPTDYEIPYTDSFNLTISHQMPWTSVFEAAYIGSRSSKMLMGGQNQGFNTGGDLINRNKMPLGALFKPDPVTGLVALDPQNPGNTCKTVGTGQVCNSYADYTPYGSSYGTNAIYVPEHEGWANYDALALTWAKPAGALSYTMNYTWSKALGTALNINPFSVGANYGLLLIERPHVFNASTSYRIPLYYHGGEAFLKGALSDWNIGAFFTWQSGADLTSPDNYSSNLGFTLNYDPSTLPKGYGSGSIGAPTYFGTTASMAIMPTLSCNPASLKLSCFGVPAVGSGQAYRGLPYIGAPAFWVSDLAITKLVHIKERHTVEIKAGANNWLNHPLKTYSGSNPLQLNFLKNYQTGTVSDAPKVSASAWGVVDSKVGQPNERIITLSATYRF